jgi:hypothetical protein
MKSSPYGPLRQTRNDEGWKGIIVVYGLPEEYRALLELREKELAEEQSRLTGNSQAEYFPRCRTRNLESQIADLREWLAEAERKEER